jgi:Raf kinase inhibitor-like YbhB/YbcL family protein
MKKLLFSTLVIVFVSVSIITIIKHKEASYNLKPQKEGKMKLTSVFEHNTPIPSEYTCDGKDIAPVLKIEGVPEGTKELALIVDDPDAPMGTWVHWVVYNLPANTVKIEQNNLPEGTKEGITDFGRIGWGGPCPPYGTHRYFFKLYALNEALDLPPGATKNQLEKAIAGHVIEENQLVGLYNRNK